MLCVNLESPTQKVVDRFEKAAINKVRAHAVVLRFQKSMLKMTTELLMFVMFVLKESFVIRIDETIFETDVSEVVTILNVFVILITLA